VPIASARAHRLRVVGIALIVGLAAAWSASTASAVPSAVVSYASTPPRAVDAYARRGNVIVVTMDQRVKDPARIRAWRRKGAIVLAYINAVDYPHRSLGPLERSFYGGSFPSGWLYPGNRTNWPGTTLLDLRSGSAVARYRGFTGRWGDYVARFIKTRVIRDGSLFNGVFLDVWGDRVWNLGVGGRGSSWDRGVTKYTRAIRKAVGSKTYLVANNTPSPATARYLNGRMFESFDGWSGGWNNLTGRGENPGLTPVMRWRWYGPRLMILWRNESSPSSSTKQMLIRSARAGDRTGRDVAVGASDLSWGIPTPFG
jgi:hypothetical protein